jgi:hypothetical protein
MATGDITWFDIALPIGFPASSAFSSDDIMSLVLLDDTTGSITSTSTSHAYTDFTESNTTGNATNPASGTTLDFWGDMWTYSGDVATFDTTTNPTFAQNSDNSTEINYAMVTNITETGKRGLCFIELGGVDGTAGDLTITFNVTGIATITSTST